MCRGSVSRIESGERTVTDIEIGAISKVLGVTLDHLFGRTLGPAVRRRPADIVPGAAAAADKHPCYNRQSVHRTRAAMASSALSGKILQHAVGADLVSARIPGGDELRPYYNVRNY